MVNNRRSTWTTILLLALLAPFVVVLAISLANSQRAAGTQPAGTQGVSSQAATEAGVGGGVLLAAGDGQTLWVARPMVADPTGRKVPAYELWARTSDTGAWTQIRDAAGGAYFSDQPRGLAVVSPGVGEKGHARVCVFYGLRGAVQAFSLTGESAAVGQLPPEHELLATAGSEEGVFAVTEGVPPAAATRPWDALNLGATTAPATSRAATEPVTTAAASEPAGRVMVNVYWLHPRWVMLPALGAGDEMGKDGSNSEYGALGAWAMGDEAREAAPREGAKVGLVEHGGRLIVMWVNPGEKAMVARSLAYHHKDAKWSGAVRSALPVEVGGDSRVMPVVVGDTVYVFWARGGAGKGLEVCGGWMITNGVVGKDLRIMPENFLPAMVLKGAGENLSAGRDVAVGATENSVAVVTSAGADGLASYVFTTQGKLAAGPTAVKAQQRHDVEFAQNLAMLLLVLMLTLSLWQWRQRPGALKLPAGLMIAGLGKRGAAFLIDVAVSFVVVSVVFGIWGSGAWYEDLTGGLVKSFLNLDNLLGNPAVMVFWGVYLLHETVGELFFQRSIGKALTGLRVMMVDGKPATVGGILVRNLVRLPELLLGILVVYLFISSNRQRLGDLLGRTLVVCEKSPDTPDEEKSGAKNE